MVKEISHGISHIALGRFLRKVRDPRQIRCFLALDAVYDGPSEAAKIGGMGRSETDFNAHGPESLPNDAGNRSKSLKQALRKMV